MKNHIILSLCLLMALSVHSQSWRAEADSLMVNHVFADKIGYVDIYTFPEVLTSADTIYLVDGSDIPVPYSNCIGYFINLMPYANWSHPCMYCFVNASNNYTIMDAEMPPYNDSLVAISRCPRLGPFTTSPIYDSLCTRISQPSNNDSEHLWAVLICGDDEIPREPDQYPKYWFDLSCVYTVLADFFGYQENIDESFRNRRIIVMAPQSVRNQYDVPDLNGNETYLNNNLWYSQDNGGDFFFSDDLSELTFHTKSNIKNVFDCFAGTSPYQEEYASFGLRKLTEKDQLFIFITGHGRREGENSVFYVNESARIKPKIRDDEFVEWLRSIECSQMALFMENCYSGGFIDRFMDDISEDDCLCKNRIGFSAASAIGPSHAEGYKVYSHDPSSTHSYDVSEFVYYWASAALGYYPYFSISNSIVTEGPWTNNSRVIGSGNMNWRDYFGNYENSYPHTRYDVNPDLDGDGILSFYEMFEFANNLDTWSSQGYCHPNTLNPEYTLEIPQQRYESIFTKEAATLIGYEGQIDSIANSGSAAQPYRLCGDIWVSPDAQLTMWDEVQSPEDVRIYVKPSGKLVLDGATLTNLPEKHSPMWKGVQVWGNSDKHQLKENGRYWQGVLEMKNGAAIRNAVTGIDAWNPEDEKSTGGIVKATDARFDNNTTAVSFHPYENQYEHPLQPGTVVVKDNVSYFKNCEFSIDEKYIGPVQFEMHVNLYRVRGVAFNGCNFKYSDNSYSKPTTMGIYAYDAGFKLGGICTSGNYSYPCQVFDNSTFDGFYKAVVSVNDGSVGIRPMTVKNTDFTNNSYGVFALRSGYPLILNSTFSIGQDSTQCAIGIYAEQTPNFTIEQDTFSVAMLHPYENYGIVVKNSKSQNQIYKNVFRGLYCANLSVGRNNTWMMPRNTTDAKANILGLEYRCNENMGNMCDFYVQGQDSYYKLGIQTNQGAVNVSANNTFSQTRYQFINHGNYGINYYYDPNQLDGTPMYYDGVTLVQTTDSTGCLSHYTYGGVSYNDTLTPVLSDAQKMQREADYFEAYTAYSTIKAVYDGMINGGDTQGEIADIQTATPSDMWSLRAQLLGHSPYLTTEALTMVAGKNDVFPQSVLYEILASNPDELKNDSLINYLQSMDNPMPDYMIDLLRQVSNGVTARTAMESQLAKYSQEYRLAACDMIRSTLNDTIIDKEALIGWYGNMNDLESDREIISLYLEDGNYTEAMTLANMLPTLYGLTGDDLVEHNNYMTLLQMYAYLASDQRNTMQLDSTERATVEYIADYGTGTPQAMAKAIMMGAYGYRYEDCPNSLDLYYPTKGMDYSGSSFSNENLGKAMGFTVDVSPNPASTWVAVDYTLPVGATEAQMRIVNMHGVTVATYILHGKESQKVLDLRDLADGVYTYTIFCGKHNHTGKLVVVK